jgi:hypothetical protein
VSGASLPELLRRLSELMPGGRVAMGRTSPGGVCCYLNLRPIWKRGDHEAGGPGHWSEDGLLQLEHALREEIEQRGWDYRQCRDATFTPQYTAVIFQPEQNVGTDGYGPTPAHALAAALVAALEGQG